MQTKINDDFKKIVRYIKENDSESIAAEAINKYMSYSDDYRNTFESQANNPMGMVRFGSINGKDKNFELIYRRVDFLKTKIDEIDLLFEQLEDFRSKKTLSLIVYNMLNFNSKLLEVIRDNIFDEYLDMDILDVAREGSVVDVGAYIGDTAENFLKYYKKNTLVCYEITPDFCEQLRKNVIKYDNHNIIVRDVGVGKEVGTMYLNKVHNGVGNFLADEGEIEIPVVPLDMDLDGNVALIKMDIEGAEYDAIEGAKKIISRDKPQLVICLYHNMEDMCEIPKLIKTIRSDYKFYLRYYGDGMRPLDYVLYAV